jgi:queuine tRNA-ribosyltransferase
MSFTITERKNGSRSGILHTRRGDVATPFFMPDATRASVRGLTVGQLKSVGVDPMVVNTYHLYLKPGMDLMKKVGGIHAFMGWDGPLLSDSGGYQVYSLIHKNAQLGVITEKGAIFKDPSNGRKYELTPERSIQIQFDLGVDMMVVLDDPRPNDASYEEIDAAVERTLRWAERCRTEFDHQVKVRKMNNASRPLLFGVVQGGPFIDLRKKCAQGLQEIGFDGYGFGGRHVDTEGQFMNDIVTATASFIPDHAPRFALGIGTPRDIVRCHHVGWDMFDCVIPTREGRHGRLFIWNENEKDVIVSDDTFYDTINITNAQFCDDMMPIDPRCDCYACTNHTRAYMHHLFRAGEMLGAHMAALHNIRFFIKLMEGIRK